MFGLLSSTTMKLTGGAQVEEKRPLRPDRRLRYVDHARVGSDIEDNATEKGPALRVERGSRIAARIVGVLGAGAPRDGVPVRVAYGR